MATTIYGASDDLIEVEGDVTGEVGCYTRSDRDPGTLLVCSDGTVLDVRYGKGPLGVWGVTSLRRGELFAGIDECHDEDAEPHSDVVHFCDGLQWVMAATEWERVK